ncbi:macrolide family glycosyltransferase [Amycolatopsis plumensis]|uniref:Macrolide family glycosyltransferase n=1 Tax=Amycolatopsis plumensis TaxID=236508 RepID=A0ABV5TUK2_9PSEU
MSTPPASEFPHAPSLVRRGEPGRARHVAVFNFPRFGHIRPTLPVVRELLRRGHRVTYFAAESYVDAVAASGADVVPYPSSFPDAVEPVHTPEELSGLLVDFLREGLAALPAARKHLGHQLPDLVLEDALSTATSALIARDAGCPVVRTFAGFGGNDEVSLDGGEPAPENPLLPDTAIIERAAEELFTSLVPYGLDEAGFEYAQRGSAVSANLVFIPKALQPYADRFDDTFAFVGPEPGPDTGALRPASDRDRTVLVSLGTSATANPQFFRGCADAFAGSGWQVVLATAGHLGAADVERLPAGVEAHDWVDHDEVFPRMRAVVCSAGAGTVLDALRHGVPVVMVPQQPDAVTFARHLQKLGLGKTLDPEEATGATIRSAVEAVTADPVIGRNVARMRTEIREAGGSVRAADVLESLWPRTTTP